MANNIPVSYTHLQFGQRINQATDTDNNESSITYSRRIEQRNNTCDKNQYWSALYNPQAQDYNGLGQQYNSKSTVVTWNNIIGWNYKLSLIHISVVH